MGRYTLHYFDARARAETIRLICAAAGTPFDDKRWEFKDWPAFKPKTPTGKLPVLEVDGQKMIPESIAIARFLARENGLVGKTSIQQAQADAVVDILTEIREGALPLLFIEDKDKKEKMQVAWEEKTTNCLTLVETALKANNEGKAFLVGDSLTWADLHFVTVVETAKGMLPDVLEPFPCLQALEKRVFEVENVANYCKNRPVNKF